MANQSSDFDEQLNPDRKKQLSSVFFPEKMNYIEMVCPTDSAYHLIKLLALQGNVLLIDHNPGNATTHKRYSDTYMQCEEAERSLRFIQEQLKKAKTPDGKSMLPRCPPYQEFVSKQSQLDLADTLQRIREDDAQLHEKVTMFHDLNSQLSQRRTKLRALRFYRPIVEQETLEQERRTSETSAVELSMLNETRIVSSVTGYVPVKSLHKMLTTVYRVSRRNVIYHIGETNENDDVPFTIFASSSTVLSKIKKVCESFSSNVFDFPGDSNALQNLEDELSAEIEQMENVDSQQREVNLEFMEGLSTNFWSNRLYIAQEKQIWQTMDYGDFDEVDSSIVYAGWCPRRLVPDIYPILEQAKAQSGSAVEIQLKQKPAEQMIKEAEANHEECIPPTYIEKNDFTAGFQMLNDAYGIPNYDELNGGAFYCMYPMLFAIMFGDMGHSIFYIIAAIALLVLDPLVKKNHWDLGDMAGSVFKFKWFLFFGAICSLYCGLIYDEAFGLPISFWESGWVRAPDEGSVEKWTRRSDFHTYPFGIDWCWYFKDNELIFLNSYKMKLAVVMGMAQMVFGMFLQLVKWIYRRNVYEILVKWLPEMLYLVPFFGYLVVIIIKKWCTDFKHDPYFDGNPDIKADGVNLIQVMIGMILSLGSKDSNLDLYDGCWNVQTIIVIIFFVSIPYLLFVKPICECIKVKMHHEQINIIEIFVMNLIDVIEFCLGALSHTASYLRLWALSLAHSQLSHVIYDELFIMTVDTNNVFLVWVGWAAFALLSAAILLAMEAFSALLHAIRLMWVEFSSKFYEGMGVAFKPISFKKAAKHLGCI